MTLMRFDPSEPITVGDLKDLVNSIDDNDLEVVVMYHCGKSVALSVVGHEDKEKLRGNFSHESLTICLLEKLS